MKSSIVIARRELRMYFSSPLAYVFMFIFTLLACGAALLPEFAIFGQTFGGMLDKKECSMVAFFSVIPFLLAFFAPAIAMKLWADEKKKGTIELLFTYPLSSSQIVLGKFAAAWFVLLFAMVMTFPMAMLVNTIGTLHYPQVVSGYLATVLLAGAFTAIACAASALTGNNVVSLIIGVFACTVLVGIDLVPFKGGILETFCQQIGALGHFQDLVAGKITLQSLVYFASVTVGCLFLNLYFLENE